ncbi:MAG: hypothetical protein U1D96_03450 [Eubacteriales bacterium]|nr:hypothetical protein [Eubacteriales bacterium]
MKNQKQFGGQVDDFFWKRIEAYNPAHESDRYCRERKVADEAAEVIEAALPQDLKHLVEKLQEAEAAVDGTVFELYYQRGFGDGVRFIMHTLALGL